MKLIKTPSCLLRHEEGFVEGSHTTCVFLHSRDTPPGSCPSLVWEVHLEYIHEWDTQQQHVHHASPQIGDMPHDHRYLRWYHKITRKYVNCNNAKLDIMVMCSA